MDLNKAMEFDHVIRVFVDGTFGDAEQGVYAPEVYVECSDDGQVTGEPVAEGWDLMTGYSGQYGCSGPIMHASEYVGGRLERDIMAESGLYVVTEVKGLRPAVDELSADPVGWVVARRRDDDL